MVELPPPPREEALDWITQAIGVEAALKLLLAYGGTRLYVPHEVNQGSDLALEIGLDAARALVRAGGGDRPRIPLRRNWMARCLRAQGKSHREIALALRVVESTVPRMLLEQQPRGAPFASKRQDGDPNQLDMFAPQTRA
jgi:hypothetical protein